MHRVHKLCGQSCTARWEKDPEQIAVPIASRIFKPLDVLQGHPPLIRKRPNVSLFGNGWRSSFLDVFHAVDTNRTAHQQQLSFGAAVDTLGHTELD